MLKMQDQFLITAFISICVLIGMPRDSWAQKPSLQSHLEKIVADSKIPVGELGLVVANAEGQILFKLNSDKYFIPASLTKIVTGAAVLEKMPIGHQFVTELRGTVSPNDSAEYKGSIYLRGGGDAGFVSESMWFLVNEFVRTGIKKISGDIIVDDSRFDKVRFDPSRDQSRVDRAYDSPIGAMTFNWSAVNIFVRPAVKQGQSAKVFVDPETRYIEIVNKAKTVAAGKRTKITVENKGLSGDKKREVVHVSGEIAVGANEFVSYKSIQQPDIWAGIQLSHFLQQRGIQVAGEVKAGDSKSAAIMLAQYKSRPVSEHVVGMMKFSNNYIAEILTKNLGVEASGEPGTMSKGIDALRKYMQEKKLGPEARLENPSGLSRKNKFSPIDILTVLIDIKQNFRLFPEFFASLPIAGTDGTLKRRLGQDRINGHVRAKTGHLTGVAGLAGYVGDDNGQIYPFVFLHNGSADNSYRAKDLFDRLIVKVAH